METAYDFRMKLSSNAESIIFGHQKETDFSMSEDYTLFVDNVNETLDLFGHIIQYMRRAYRRYPWEYLTDVCRKVGCHYLKLYPSKTSDVRSDIDIVLQVVNSSDPEVVEYETEIQGVYGPDTWDGIKLMLEDLYNKRKELAEK